MNTQNNLPSLTCPTANNLRLAWYNAATQLSLPPKASQDIAAVYIEDRDKPAYYGAKTRLLIHIESCPICKGE